MNTHLGALSEIINSLTQRLPELGRRRSTTPFANDVFELVDDVVHLGRDVLEENTKANYPAIARSEVQRMDVLRTVLSSRLSAERDYYAPIIRAAEQVLEFVGKVQPLKDGHLGTLRIIRQLFAFLETDYGFRVRDERPTGRRYSSGTVYVELQWAKKYSSSSCWFGSESDPKSSFWIEDLLFMHGDQRYRTLPEDLGLDTEDEVQGWFTFLADIFKQYGHDVLTGSPGIFEELAEAQERRGQEHSQEMERLYGKGRTN